MSTITRDNEAVEAQQNGAPPAEPTVPEAPPPVAARTCADCGAEMAPEQDWCLECGAAQPERSGLRPPWRTGVAVLATTGVLAAGAVAAAYAGLSQDAKRAAAPNAQASLPAPAATPPAAPPPPAATTPAAPAPAPSTTPKPAAVTPPAPSTPTPPVTPAPTAPAATKPAAPVAPKKTTTSPAPKANTGPLVALRLKPTAASTYNPYARPTTDFTDAKLALDGNKATSWTASFNGGDALVGVLLDLGSSQGLRALQLATTTPGMTVEVYGARGAQPPVSIQDPKWDHITTQLDVAKDGRIVLGDGVDRYRWLLLWPTQGPADGGNQVAVSELKVYR